MNPIPEPPNVTIRKQMAKTVRERGAVNDSEISEAIAAMIMDGLVIYEADKDVLTLTTAGYLHGPLDGFD